MALEIWTPESARGKAEPQRVIKCMVPGCGRTFPATHRQQAHRHISACAKRNLDQIQEITEARRDAFNEPTDKEMHNWVRRKAAEVGPDEANKRLRGRRGR